MPTILQGSGFRIVIYTNDHNPPHVHVVGPQKSAKVEIEGGVRLVQNIGFSAAEMRRAVTLIEERRDELLAAWRKLHG